MNGLSDVCFVFEGEHVPAGKDSALLHPETMKTLEVSIATHVVVRVGWKRRCQVNGVRDGAGESGEDGDEEEKEGPAYVCCKVWPCTSIALDGEGYSSLPAILSVEDLGQSSQ